MKEFNSMEFCGYEQKTTFFSDLSIADAFGIPAIKDTYDRAFEMWHKNYIYLTELVMVLNWKIWQHHEEGREEYAQLYDKLWKEADEYACNHLKGEELAYFYRTTD
jgi:hypothetical protein